MKTFETFELGDNVAELSDRLIPEMAEAFEMPLGEEPSADELGALVGAIGTKKTLQENLSGAKAWLTEWTGSEEQAAELAVQWMGRSGVQSALDRSLWTSQVATPADVPIVITGAVANWQDRVAQLLEGRPATSIFIPVGNREMGSPTEVINENVQAFQAEEERLPLEHEYAQEFVAPLLRAAGCEVELVAYETGNGQEIAQRFVEDREELFGQPVAFARVANAGIQLACQFREAARQAGIAFDTDSSSPESFVLTDSYPVARTPEELANAKRYQNPFTGIRQIALTAKLLREAAS